MCSFDYADVLYDSWSPAMRLSSICLSILSMLSSSSVKVCVFYLLLIFQRLSQN